MKGLLIQQPWIEEILAGRKTWELRGTAAKQRGEVALIQSKSGTVVGVAELVDSVGPLSIEELRQTTERHRVPAARFDHGSRYKKTYAWVFRDAQRLAQPVPYKHPNGAVIWVKLEPSVIAQIREQRSGGA